jgi:pSer/pThr/pTyr-binding forkhead associated (FHA) protein
MGPLAAVERFLERLFERQSARLFRTAIRPVQVQRRLERAMEGNRARDGARTIVPHRFVVRLQPDDLAALRVAAPQLASSLADSALAFARSHGYTLLDRPVVAIRADPSVDTGDITVDSVDPHARSSDADPRVDVDPGVHAADGEQAAQSGEREATSPDPRVRSVAQPSQPLGDGTAVFVVPGMDGPRATIREIRPDRSSRSIAFDGRPLTIGRGSDNGLVLRDGRASRHHARIDGRRGSLVLSDLGSTNGSFVNDRRVDSIALGEGDRIRIGATTLLVEAIATPAADRPQHRDAGEGDVSSRDASSGDASDDRAPGAVAG